MASQGSPTRRAVSKRTLVVVSAVAWLTYTIALGAIYLQIPPNPDQAIFDYIGWVLDRGGKAYLSVTEVNFPGEMWLHAVSTGLFGNHLWSYRLLDYVLMVGAAALLVRVLFEEVGWRGLVVGPLYQAMYVTSGAWMAGQRDVTAAHFLLAAALVYRARTRGGSRLWLLPFGPLIVFAVLIRPTYAMFPALVVLIDLVGAKARSRSYRTVLADGALAALGCLVPVALLVFVASRTGQLDVFLVESIRYSVEQYTRRTYGEITIEFLGMFESWHWYVAFSVAGAVLWWKHTRDRALWAIPIAMGVTAIGSAYAQLKGFLYHLAGLLPVMALFIAYLLVWAVSWVRSRQDYPRVALAGALSLVALLGIGSKFLRGHRSEVEWLFGQRSSREVLAARNTGLPGTSYADVLDASDYLRDAVPPGKTILVWMRLVHINFLAERLSPIRFITVGMLRHARSPTFSVPWTKEVSQSFSTHPPEAIVVLAEGLPGDEGFWSDRNPSGPLRVVREQTAARYQRTRRFGNMQVFRLRPGG